MTETENTTDTTDFLSLPFYTRISWATLNEARLHANIVIQRGRCVVNITFLLFDDISSWKQAGMIESLTSF